MTLETVRHADWLTGTEEHEAQVHCGRPAPGPQPESSGESDDGLSFADPNPMLQTKTHKRAKYINMGLREAPRKSDCMDH